MKTNKFKKLMAVTIVGLMTMGTLAGCGSAADGSTDSSSAAEKEVITMGTNAAFEPFEYIQGTEIVGFDVEIAKIIAEELGKELVIQDMGFDQLLGAVDTGKVDFIAAGMTATEERAEQVDFTDAYFQSKQVIIINENQEGIAIADDLVGKKVGVQIGTTGDLFVSGIEGIEVVRFDTGAMAVMDLTNGKVDAVVIDEQPGHRIVSNHDAVTVLDAPFIEEEYAIAVQKGNTELLESIDAVLDQMVEDGTYDELYAQFFGTIE